MRILIKIVLLGLIIYTFGSCMEDQGPVYINPCPCDLTPIKDCDCDEDTILEISFKRDIQLILDLYCVRCHAEECKYVNFKKGKAYENMLRYINLENPIGSVVYQSIILGYMPTDGDRPTEKEEEMLLEWIKQGAKNN